MVLHLSSVFVPREKARGRSRHRRYPVAERQEKLADAVNRITSIVLVYYLNCYSRIEKHGKYAEMVRNCPQQNIGLILQNKIGDKMILCQIEKEKWGAMIQNSAGNEKTSFVNSLRKLLKYGRNQGFDKVEFYKPNMLEEISNLLASIGG